MAKLALVVERLDDIEEAIRPLYTEKDGRFHLDVDGVDDMEATKQAIKKANKEAEQERVKRKAWDKLGKSPEEIEQLLESQRKAEEEKSSKAGDFEKMKASLVASHQDELAKRDAQLKSMRKSLERYLIDAQATAAIAAAKGEPELLLPIVQRRVQVKEDGDNYNVVVLDANGEPDYKDGKPKSVGDLLEDFKKDTRFGRAFEGSGHSGSGTLPGNGGGATSQFKRRSEFKTEKERSAFVDQHGIDAYQKLPA